MPTDKVEDKKDAKSPPRELLSLSWTIVACCLLTVFSLFFVGAHLFFPACAAVVRETSTQLASANASVVVDHELTMASSAANRANWAESAFCLTPVRSFRVSSICIRKS